MTVNGVSFAYLNQSCRQQIRTGTQLYTRAHTHSARLRSLYQPGADAIVAAADKVGAWILADEVYRGAERTREDETPSFFGRYDKVLAQGSMSKAYGLPGLRVGWTVGPAEAVASMWRRHEYTTITVTMLSNHLSATALSPMISITKWHRALRNSSIVESA